MMEEINTIINIPLRTQGAAKMHSPIQCNDVIMVAAYKQLLNGYKKTFSVDINLMHDQRT